MAVARRPGLVAVAPEDDDDMFLEGDIIDRRFRIMARLGRGGYGEIYSCKVLKTDQSVAVKVERISKPGNLLEEDMILRCLKPLKADCRYVPHLVASGKHENRINYIAMELLGENMSTLRRNQPTHRFSITTGAAIAMQMLRALRDVHEAGFLHRDIKPGNFVLGTVQSGNPRSVIIIDFGLSRRHLKPDGSVKPKRAMARWVGSRRYMSINTHLRKDQGRRDDLLSWLYVVVELLTGLGNLDRVRDMKLLYNNEKLVRGLPDEFMKLLLHIKSLKFESRPDYQFLHETLLELYKNSGGTALTPYDWETESDVKTYSCIPFEGETDEEPESIEELSDEREEQYSQSMTTTSSSISDDEMIDNHSPSLDHGKRKGRCTIL